MSDLHTYIEELPTERTATIIMTLNMDGRTLIPAFEIASTNGEAFASTEESPFSKRGSFHGTRRPTKSNETI